MSSHSVQSTPPLSQSPAPLSPASSHGHHVSTTTATHLVNGQLAVQDPSSGPVRRKTSRRANTAERRATHNAVERQRRETLNSRFLDLAALLPNLAAVRRPSKSAIVNSSIALIHTQRRQRALAARELRIIKAETDALRAELNEWRGRNGHARVDEPPRTQEFLTLLTLEEVTAVEEEEIRRAYEMASIPVGDEDEDGYIDAPGMYTAEPAPMMPPQHHGAPVNMAPPPPPPPHINAPAPPTMHHHELQAQLHAAALLQSQAQGRPNVHIPAFDGPNIFPGPGHHAHHAQAPAAHHVPQQHQHAPAPQIPTQNMFPPQFNHPSPGAIGGSPPHPGHFQPYPPSQRSPQAYRDVNIYSREGAPAQFAHAPPLAPTQSLSGVRDDDSVSSSSGGGSPPATAGSFPSYASQQQGAAGADVPALAAGATPADFARFWAQASPTKVAAGFPMGFAM